MTLVEVTDPKKVVNRFKHLVEFIRLRRRFTSVNQLVPAFHSLLQLTKEGLWRTDRLAIESSLDWQRRKKLRQHLGKGGRLDFVNYPLALRHHAPPHFLKPA